MYSWNEHIFKHIWKEIRWKSWEKEAAVGDHMYGKLLQKDENWKNLAMKG